VDETIISLRHIIRIPSAYNDSILDTIWVLGSVDRADPCNFYVRRVRNRQVDTLYESLQSIIRVGSILNSDGYS
jgi:hypothetical protein